MPLETFTGPNITGLLANARRAIGADAVLLSVRRVGDHRAAGFEIVAADPTTASVARPQRRPPAGVPAAPATAPTRPLRPAPAPAPAPPRRAVSAVPLPAGLLSMTPLLTSPGARRRREPVVVALVGPTGAGKTTTIAKLARHPKVFDGLPVGVLCLDTYRIGAVEQLRIYAEISGLPLEVAYEAADLQRALRRLRDCEIVLVDTAGRGPAGLKDSVETRAQLERLEPAEVHLTLPAGLQPLLARRVLADHRAYGVTHVLATKLDEYPGDATVFEIAAESGLPMRWFTNGQEVPMDLQHAAPRFLEATARASGAGNLQGAAAA
jgi:flagellar biosynthesis protein FlhF